MKKKRNPTYSVRHGGLSTPPHDRWLTKDGEWTTDYAARKKFKTQDAAEQAARLKFGSEFKNYGIFANS